MDIDLGRGMDGIEAAARILDDRDLSVVFLSSHTDPAIVKKTERITSYGYIVKDSGETVLTTSLQMAFRLFEARNLRLETIDSLAHEKERLRVTLQSVGDEYQIADSAEHIRDAGVRGSTGAPRARARHEARPTARQPWFVAVRPGLRYGRRVGAGAPHLRGCRKGSSQSYPLPHYRQMLDAALVDLIERGTPYDVEFEIRRPNDGEIRVIHSVAEYDADENAVVGTLHDVTERRRAERELREERTRFATITELSPIGITTVYAEGVITYANPTAERILGLHRDEITSRTYDAPEWEHTAPDGGSFPDEDQPFTIVGRPLQPVYEIRHGITWPDGRHVELPINASPILDDEGGFAGMVATIDDFTERKRNEERVQTLVREKRTLLRDSHHRITNNMNTLHSLLSLQAHTTDSPEACEVLSDASGRLQAMSRLYDRLFRNTPDGPTSIHRFLVPLTDKIV